VLPAALPKAVIMLPPVWFMEIQAAFRAVIPKVRPRAVILKVCPRAVIPKVCPRAVKPKVCPRAVIPKVYPREAILVLQSLLAVCTFNRALVLLTPHKALQPLFHPSTLVVYPATSILQTLSFEGHPELLATVVL